MRFKFDSKKSDILRADPRRRIGFDEVQEIWRHPHFVNCRADNPEQFRAIGWVGRKNYMKPIADKKNPTAEELAEKAMNGEDINRFFTNKGEMKPAIQRVNVDFTVEMLNELDAVAKQLNVSRQSVIKTYIRKSLDQHYLAKKAAASQSTG